jgi:hypothetical protein
MLRVNAATLIGAVALNAMLIPAMGALGAAVATLLALSGQQVAAVILLQRSVAPRVMSPVVMITIGLMLTAVLTTAAGLIEAPFAGLLIIAALVLLLASNINRCISLPHLLWRTKDEMR